jgi:hypothetical protein
MKIAWVSPFNRSSAIGYYSSIVCAALRGMGHEVCAVKCDALRPGESDTFDHDITFGRFRARGAGDFDTVVYNLGNEYTNHGVLMDDDLPLGVFILHDLCYPHLFFAWCAHQGRDPMALLSHLSRLGIVRPDYRAVYNRVEQAGSPDEAITELAQLNMIGWVTRNATRLILHTPSARLTIASATGLRVDHLPLAYWTAERTAALARIEPPAHAGLTLSSFGLGVANKRITSLIHAIGGDADLAERWQLRLVGRTDDLRSHYSRVAAEQPHPVRIAFLGEVDDATFEAEMRAADYVSCLRRPSYESGSATLVMALAINGNVLVSQDSSSSATVAGLATMVRPDSEIEDIRAALIACQNGTGRSEADRVGIRHRAREMFDAGHYARDLVAMLEGADESVARARAFKSILPEGDAYALALRRFCGPEVQAAARRADAALSQIRKAAP